MMAAMGIGSLLVLLMFWLLLNKNIKTILADRNESTHQTLERIIGLEGNVMRGFARDYTYWKDSVDFVASTNDLWVVQNLETALASFNCDACWVFKPDYSLVAYRSSGDVALDSGDLQQEVVKSIFADQKFPHWFARIADVTVEFRGSPIQPTTDIERLTPAQGYLVVARIWSSDRLNELKLLFGATDVRLINGSENAPFDQEHGAVGCSSHVYDLPVAGGEGILLEAELCSPALDRLIQLNGFASVVVSLMLILIVAFLAIGLTLWVSAPITLMSSALANRDTSLVAPLVSQKNEIGRLARLIVSFFRQQHVLEEEVAHRKEMQKRQDKLSAILRIWGQCNFALATCSSEEEMLSRVCRIIASGGGYRFVWVGNVTWTGSKASVEPISAYGDDGGFMDAVKNGLAVDAMKSKCIVGNTLRSKEVSSCRGGETSEEKCEKWERIAAKCGLKSAACFPVINHGEIFAVLTILSSEPADLGADERSALAEVVENLGAGMLLRRSEQARSHAETRAADLSDQLLRTQKLEAVGRLAGGIAHDFNNLLFVIMGNLEIALSNGAGCANSVELTEAMEASRQASQLTKQLMALGRRRVAVAKPVDVNREIEKALDLMKSALEENVEVRLNLDDRVGLLLGDPMQIKQVFMNLAINAGEAMPSGGTFTITTESVCVESDFAPDAVPGDYVLVSLTDTGVGMDDSTLQHAFEPFFTTKEEGTGLGLSLVSSIVSQHDGFIRVSSVRGAGTTFRIFLPIADVLPGGENEVASMDVLRARHDETILLVEDRDMCRMLTKTMLQSLGYTVIEAVDGRQAIDLVSSETKLDVILTDVVMPGLSGPEMVLKLKDNGVTARVVYMSGYADGALAEHGLAGTRVGLLQKPFMLAQLAQIILEAITKG